MILKKYLEFIKEEKEDDETDHYYDNQIAKLDTEIKDYSMKKSKLEALIKTYDYSDGADRNLNKIIESNRLLLQYWSILKKKKRVIDLNEKIDAAESEIKELKKEDASPEEIEKKQEKINSINEEINKIEKENRDLEKELNEMEKEIKRKIDYLKQKLFSQG
jgi:predicted transcriptional regulator